MSTPCLYVIAFLAVCVSSATARSAEREVQLILVDPETVYTACQTKSQVDGVICRVVPDVEFTSAASGDDKHYQPLSCAGRRIPGTEAKVSNMLLKRRECGEILITKKAFAPNADFYEALVLRVRTSDLGNDSETSVMEDDGGRLSRSIASLGPFAPISSEEAARYVASVSDRSRATEAAKQKEHQQLLESQQSELAYEQSPAAKQSDALGEISYCKYMIGLAEKALDADMRASKISGVTNLATRQRAGQIIVQCQDKLTSEWKVYKSNGGAARSIRDIPATSTAAPKIGIVTGIGG